ncbi:hypothetical protein EPI10_031009 [Gossypium australe]|uniref:Uncharacterized protein n=1 Tax=Gossypium australe TaxID=47621 RepID=A0A5B6X0G3_9ROSI|nr:hypothetical protein EPI10_031009 [Gossypium australe]
MTQSGSIPIEPYPDPERILRCNCHLMKNNPHVGADLPRENLLFDDPPEPQAQICGELLMDQRTLCEYALPTLDAVLSNGDDPNDPKYRGIPKEHDGGSKSTPKVVPPLCDLAVVHLRLFPFSLCDLAVD